MVFHSLSFLFVGRARARPTQGDRSSAWSPPDVFTVCNSDPRISGDLHVGTKFLTGNTLEQPSAARADRCQLGETDKVLLVTGPQLAAFCLAGYSPSS